MKFVYAPVFSYTQSLINVALQSLSGALRLLWSQRKEEDNDIEPGFEDIPWQHGLLSIISEHFELFIIYILSIDTVWRTSCGRRLWLNDAIP